MSTFQHNGTVQLPATDPDALRRLERFGGVKLLDEMIALFLESAPERLSAAASALEAGDPARIENAMHALKSSSAQLGALAVSRISEQAETIARGGALGGIAGLLDQCREELARAAAWMESVRAERSA